MDPGGSDLDSSLPQPENPCLIVEDSQPDSVALEDDPESSYRALLARRLSSLQPTSRSPVLELISSPLGSRCSQTDSQSENNDQAEPDIHTSANLSSAFLEESQVINLCRPPNKTKCIPEEMDSGADSTTHCIQSEGGSSQFDFLELSQSQDLRAEEMNSQDKDIIPQSDSERRSKLAGQNVSSGTSASQDNKAVRSEVSSSSSSESLGQSGRQQSIQALLHSQNLQASGEQDTKDCEILSSQQDLFDADKTGAAVDSTVCEPEQQGHPTPTPAHTLRLLHLSGQEMLVQESLSQSSVDYVAPTPDNFSHTPLIVPSSPTGPENENSADEPMDTSVPPDDQAGEKEEPMETEATSKTQPSASTPVSQNSPGFVLEQTLSIPSQPEFSHDVFVPTQSQEAPQQSNKKLALLPSETQSQQLESTPFTLPLQLSVNTESSSSHQQTSEQVEEDSQATQIEDLEEPRSVDTSDSVISYRDQKRESKAVPSESQAATSSKASTSTEAPKHHSECAKTEPSNLSQKSDRNKNTATSLNVQNVNVKDSKGDSNEVSSADLVSCSQPKPDSPDLTVNSCVQETPSDTTPCSLPSLSMISQSSAVDVVKSSADLRGGTAKSQSVKSLSQQHGAPGNSQTDKNIMDEREQGEEEEEEVVMEADEGENTAGASGMVLALSQSQLLSPEPMEEEEEEEESKERRDDSVIIVTDSERDSQIHQKDTTPQSKTNGSQPLRDKASASTNGHESQPQEKKTSVRLSQTEKMGREAEGVKDKSLSDSSGEISFHFTLPKEGELIGPAIGATPPLINQLKQTLRHSTPIEITSFSKKSDAAGDVVMASSEIVSGESGEDTTEKGDGKLSLRMKLVTPVEEGSSERFSLQKPSLSEEDGAVTKVTTVSKTVTSSPSVFTRVRQVHRQQVEEEDNQPGGNATLVRGELFASPQRSSQASLPGCNSLPNSQSEPSQQEASATPQQSLKETAAPSQPSEERRGLPEAPEPPPSNRTDVRQRVVSQQIDDNTTTTTTSPSNKLHQRTVSQQTSFDAPGLRSPAGRGEPESPSFRRTTVPSHRRHVRTIQEVRTTITRIITDVYYEDGKEVDRKVTEESEEPVVDCQVLDSDISPCRTGSSLTSGDLADISSLSSKASSLQHSSGGTSGASHTRPDFIMPPSRGAKSISPRRGGGHQQRGHRGHRAGSLVTMNRGYATLGSRAFVPLTPRGRARRGRPPSRSFPSRGGGAGSLQRLGAHGHHPLSSSEDEPYGRMLPPRIPISPVDPELTSHSDSLRSSPEEANSAGSSFVGLRVVAKWSSNGYFYSGRIIKDAGEGRFRLRFDDGYECEVAGKDILLCDPIPLETEVTALLEDEYFSIGVVKGHKTEGQELFYSVEKEGQRQWYNRTSVILSLEQGNKLREQHSLGPYEPSNPLTKASDISLDNLVEGKRRRRGAPSGQNTPNRTSSSSPRTPGPSGKRKLMTSDNSRSPAKRGRRGAGARAAQRVGVCNTSGSGTDLAGQSDDVAETHGPLPQNTSLFMGFAFMLTASSEIDRLTNKLTSDDDEEDYVETGPYNKAYTESQLQAGGGFILPDFNEEQCKAAYQSLLIADQHCRTRKYLLCLASGVPCVSHIWVRDCCKENKLLNYRNYLLPAGVGPDDAIIEWHPRCSPFKALKILLVFEKPVELWAQLITMGGGSSVRQFQADKDSSDIPVGKYDVVVTDSACPPLVKKNVTSQEVPLVSPEWLIQSLICGERLGFHSKPQYRHDSSSSS